MKNILGFFVGNSDNSLNFRYKGIIRFIPLILAGGFFALTIFLHAFGPTDWNVTNPLELYSFLIACVFALVIGYMLAVYKTKNQEKRMNINSGRILMVGAIVFLILFFPLCRMTTGKWLPDVYLGITNTGAAYQLTKYYSVTGSKLFFYIRILLSPFIFVVMPITLFFFTKLTRVQKALGIAAISLNVALGIAQGVNKHVADIVMQLVLVLAILFFSNGKQTKKERIIYRAGILVLIGCICVSFLLYYSNAMKNRVAMDLHMEAELGSQMGGNEGADTGDDGQRPDIEDVITQKPNISDNVVSDSIDAYANFSVGQDRQSAFWNAVIPEKIKPVVNYMISYFCHGYNGLSFAMEEEFTCTYGLGFSDFIRHHFARFFGGEAFEEEIYERTYMGKVEKQGWKTGLMWSSFFIFPASDLSFVGTVLLVCLIGFLFGLSWKDTITTENPFACAAFFGFTTMVFYFSANNQLFQTGENCVAFLCVLLAWFVSRTLLLKRAK